MSKQIIHSDQAPAAIGAYSQAVRAGNTVYLSGQIPLDPASMEMVAGGFAEQAHQVFKNLRAVRWWKPKRCWYLLSVCWQSALRRCFWQKTALQAECQHTLACL